MTDKPLHRVDHEVHPKAGIVFLVWGGLVCTGALWHHGFGERSWATLTMGLGMIFYGAALRTPAGTARRWLVRGWLATIGILVAVMVWTTVTNAP